MCSFALQFTLLKSTHHVLLLLQQNTWQMAYQNYFLIIQSCIIMRFKLRLYLLQLCTLQCFKKTFSNWRSNSNAGRREKMFSISSSYEGVFFKVRITTFNAKHKWNMSCLVCNFFFQFTIWNLNNAVGILLNLLFNLTIMSCRGLFK